MSARAGGAVTVVFFFHGPNSYAARQQIAKLTAQYIAKTGTDLGLERIDGARISLGELKSSLQAVPFLASSRLVIVEDLGTNKAVAPKISVLLEQIPATTVAVFYDPAVDHRTTYFKDIKAAASEVEFKTLDRGKLQRWVIGRVEAQGGRIEMPAVGRLIDRAGEDQWRLDSEIAKLLEYANPIDITAVEQQVELNPSDSVFDLVEAVTAGQQQQALELFGRLQRSGHHETYILSMVIWQLRNLIAAKAAGKINAPALARAGSMSPFVATKMLSKRHLFSKSTLKQAFLEAVELDYAIKSGQSDSALGVEQLLMELSDRFGGRATQTA